MVTLSSPGSTELGELASFVGAGRRVLRYRVVRASPQLHELVYLHGIESHGGWFLPAAQGLAERGCTTYLVDRRGSGLNRDEAPGDAESAGELLEDVHRFRSQVGVESVVLVGLSWGGKLAVAAALDEPEGVRALVLVTPGLVPRVDLPRMEKVRLVLSSLVGGRARFELPIEPEMFTRTPRFLDAIEHDPLRLQRVTARFLLASRSLDHRIRTRIHMLAAPVLVLLAGQDRIVDNQRTRALLERIPHGLLRVRVYESSTHSIQLDDTADLVHDVSSFLDDVPC